MQTTGRRNLGLFLCAVVLSGAASGLYETVFSNVLDHTFQIGAATHGKLEFPRELPGFLTALFAGLLFFVPETWIGAVAAAGIGQWRVRRVCDMRSESLTRGLWGRRSV